MALTLTDALTHLRSRLDEPTSAFWSDAELTRWINEGANDIARRTECLRDEADIAATAGTQDYTAPVDLIRATGLEWRPTSTDHRYPLQYRDRHNADSVWGAGQASSDGAPMIWTSWGFPPALTIKVFPTPNEDGNLHIYYYRLPAAVSAGVDVIETPSGWEDLVLEYATMLAYRKDGNPSWQQAFQHYEQRVTDLLNTAIRFNDQAGYIDDVSPLAPMWLYEGTGW